MPQSLPPNVRPLAFAEGELVLELIYLLQSHYKLCLDSIVILLCINDATMRPFMVGGEHDAALMQSEQPPEEIRGSISRLMIADKTGLPRETVRRKCRDLLREGYIHADDEDRLRVRSDLANVDVQRGLEGGHRAVLRYLERLRSFGVDC